MLWSEVRDCGIIDQLKVSVEPLRHNPDMRSIVHGDMIAGNFMNLKASGRQLDPFALQAGQIEPIAHGGAEEDDRTGIWVWRVAAHRLEVSLNHAQVSAKLRQ